MLERDGFAHSAAAQNAERFAGVDEEAHVIEDYEIAEGFRDVLKGNIRLGRPSGGILDNDRNLCAANQMCSP